MPDRSHRFCALWLRCRLTETAAEAEQAYAESVCARLLAMYNEQWRVYHSIDHIDSCLGFFDHCRGEADSPDAIELALWFHDCIYRVGAHDNEARSRDWFLQVATDHIEIGLRDRVAELIMDTRHRDMPHTGDGKLLADIDMTSFGLPWEQYIQDSANVSQEMSVVGAEPGNDKKLAFLNALLARDSVYFSAYYREHYEASAQQNLQRHTQLLQSQQ